MFPSRCQPLAALRSHTPPARVWREQERGSQAARARAVQRCLQTRAGCSVGARELGARTLLIACTDPPDAMRAVADICMLPVVGPEALTGSTRLKAGTATKLVCNMLTTGAMIRVGKSYGNLMVDLRATNVKLQDRAERIVMEVTELSREAARGLLAQADGRVKLALVMHALHIDAATARRRLEEGQGVVRRVVPNAPPPVV